MQKQSKEFLEHMLDDENIKKKTAAAVWGVIGNMLLPGFLFKSGPSTSNPNAGLALPTSTTTSERVSASSPAAQQGAPWYYFSGVLGWVLPSFRKSEITVPPSTQVDINHVAVPDPSYGLPCPPAASSACADSAQTPPSIPSSNPSLSSVVRAEQSNTLPADVFPISRENASAKNVTREIKITQGAQIPAAPPDVALLVPPSSGGDDGDNSFTDDDRRGTGNCGRRS